MSKAMEAMRWAARVRRSFDTSSPHFEVQYAISERCFSLALRVCEGSQTNFQKLLRVRKFVLIEAGITGSLKGDRVHYIGRFR